MNDIIHFKWIFLEDYKIAVVKFWKGIIIPFSDFEISLRVLALLRSMKHFCSVRTLAVWFLVQVRIAWIILEIGSKLWFQSFLCSENCLHIGCFFMEYFLFVNSYSSADQRKCNGCVVQYFDLSKAIDKISSHPSGIRSVHVSKMALWSGGCVTSWIMWYSN